MVGSVDVVVLHSSWRGIVGSVTTVLVLVASTVVAWGAGATIISVVLTVVTVGVAGVVAFDYPLAASFGPDGITRRCLLRRHRLAWDEVETLTRAADGARLDPSTSVGDRRRTVRSRPASLVAVVGRRRYLLLNQSESRPECEALRRRLADWEVPTSWAAGLPAEDQPPTWLYRRRRWRP